MRTHYARVAALTLVVTLAGCAPTSDRAETTPSVEPSMGSVASPSPSEQAETFPNHVVEDIDGMAASLVDALSD